MRRPVTETHASFAKLNHMSFPTNDVAATSSFFETYLGFTLSTVVETHFAILKRPGLDVVIEHAAPDAPTIRTIGADKIGRAYGECVSTDPSGVRWPMSFHIGLELPSHDDVRALHDRFAADGFIAETPVFHHERGSRFFLRAPGGVMIEFNTRADADVRYRGTFD